MRCTHIHTRTHARTQTYTQTCLHAVPACMRERLLRVSKASGLQDPEEWGDVKHAEALGLCPMAMSHGYVPFSYEDASAAFRGVCAIWKEKVLVRGGHKFATFEACNSAEGSAHFR
eukprot:1136811-Pelagomonas_calceolata.AAC.5